MQFFTIFCLGAQVMSVPPRYTYFLKYQFIMVPFIKSNTYFKAGLVMFSKGLKSIGWKDLIEKKKPSSATTSSSIKSKNPLQWQITTDATKAKSKLQCVYCYLL